MLVWYLQTAVGADQVFVPGRRHPPMGSAPPGCEPLRFTDYEQALAWCDAEYPNLAAAIATATTWPSPSAGRRVTVTGRRRSSVTSVTCPATPAT
jgi:hypothetical protein